MNMRWFHLVPKEEMMESHDGNYIAELNFCWNAIIRGVKSGLLSTESDVEEVADDFGFEVVWWGDEE